MLNCKKSAIWVIVSVITTVIIAAGLTIYFSTQKAGEDSLLVKLTGSNDLEKIEKFELFDNYGSTVTITDDDETLEFLKKYTYSHKYPGDQLHTLLVFPSENLITKVTVSGGKTFNMYLMDDRSIVLQSEDSYDVYTAKKRYSFDEKTLIADSENESPKYKVTGSVCVKDSNGEILLNSDNFDTAQVTVSGEQFGVMFTLTDEGKDLFADITAEHIGENLDLCVEDEIVSSPQVVAAITEGEVFLAVESREKAQEIVNLVKSE